jgi:hypothetical protein
MVTKAVIGLHIIDGEKRKSESFSYNTWPLTVSIKMAELAESFSSGVQANTGMLLNINIEIINIKPIFLHFLFIYSPKICIKE